MKRYFLSALTVLIASTAVVSSAQAKTIDATRLDVQAKTRTGPNRQVSTPSELSEDATFHDLLRHNRRVRNKN